MFFPKSFNQTFTLKQDFVLEGWNTLLKFIIVMFIHVDPTENLETSMQFHTYEQSLTA